MVDGNVEEPLDLGGVQIHAQDPMRARGGDEVRHQLGGDGYAALVLAVLPRVAEVGNHRRDPLGGCPAETVDEDQQLHEIGVDRIAGGLHDEAVAATDVLFDLDQQFAVGEELRAALRQRDIEVLAHELGQLQAGSPGEHLQMVAVSGTHGCDSRRAERMASTSASCSGVLMDRTSSGGTASTISTRCPCVLSRAGTSVT